jgi:hypothetical protein
VALAVGGCVRRTLTITSDPPGALVYLNDQEVGRTPLQRDFTWYGHYSVDLRHEGYQTVRTRRWLVAPWWQWPPFDLVAELLPLRLNDDRTMQFSLVPVAEDSADPQAMVSRAQALRDQLQSSPRQQAVQQPRE